jgi:hypothetical protein
MAVKYYTLISHLFRSLKAINEDAEVQLHVISSKVIGGADQGKTSYMVSVISSNASVLMAEFCTKKLRKTQ